MNKSKGILLSQLFWLFTLLPLATLVTAEDTNEEVAKAQEIVDEAKVTYQNFVVDPNMTWFRNHVQDAKAILIVPSLVKAGFIFGGSGGSGVLLARDEQNDTWSYPAFYTMGSVTWGLQLGAEKAEVILLVMTDKGMDAMLSTKFQAGADASIAAGPVGTGAQAATADILQFSRAKGLFGGLTLEGAVIAVRDKWNHAYYGPNVRPVDILVRQSVSNEKAKPLIQVVEETKIETE